MLIINLLFYYSKKFVTFAIGNKTKQIYNTNYKNANFNGNFTIQNTYDYG